MPEPIVLLIRDTALRDLCRAELNGHPVAVAESASELPRDAALCIADLDGIPLSDIPAPVIGITRRESAISPSTRAACAEILHRPFTLEAFHAAVSAHVGTKRTQEAPSRSAPRTYRILRKREAAFNAPALHLDPDRCAIVLGTVNIPLTHSEYTICKLLIDANGLPVSRASLSDAVGTSSDANVLDVHICSIRKKLAPYGKDVLIRTVRGKGYALMRI